MVGDEEEQLRFFRRIQFKRRTDCVRFRCGQCFVAWERYRPSSDLSARDRFLPVVQQSGEQLNEVGLAFFPRSFSRPERSGALRVVSRCTNCGLQAAVPGYRHAGSTCFHLVPPDNRAPGIGQRVRHAQETSIFK